MWERKHKQNAECGRVCDSLEVSVQESRGGIAGVGTLLAELPENLRKHVCSCEACRIFVEELVEARQVLSDHANSAEPGPFFVARVMASIAAREVELEQMSETWAAVPRLASRLTVLASLGLLIAATWVYQMSTPSSVIGWNSQQWAGLVDTSVQDDLLVSPADK